MESLHIHFWWMALFLFDLTEAVLCAWLKRTHNIALASIDLIKRS